MSKGLDWAKTGTVEAMAWWLLEKSGAIAVVVVRRDDAVMACSPDCKPRDARELVDERWVDLDGVTAWDDKTKRKTGRLLLGPCEGGAVE